MNKKPKIDLIALGNRIKQLRIAKGYEDHKTFAEEHGFDPDT